MDSEDEEEQEVVKGPKFPITMHISEGNKYLRLMKYATAIEFFDVALQTAPTDERSLIGRSKCNMRLAKYSEAKEDAEAALAASPKSAEAKLLIGEADYFLGDFEKAFLTFYRAHAVKSNCKGLELGHQMCRKAIDNALNPDNPMKFDATDISNLSKAKLKESDDATPARQKFINDILLPDVRFVNNLLNDDSAESVHPDCKYLFDYLKDRQQFWKTQKPETSGGSQRSQFETKQKTTQDPAEKTNKSPETKVQTLDDLSSEEDD